MAFKESADLNDLSLRVRDVMFYSISIKSWQVWIGRERESRFDEPVGIDSQWHSFLDSPVMKIFQQWVTPGIIISNEFWSSSLLKRFEPLAQHRSQQNGMQTSATPTGRRKTGRIGLKCQFVQTADYEEDVRSTLRQEFCFKGKFPLLFASHLKIVRFS